MTVWVLHGVWHAPSSLPVPYLYDWVGFRPQLDLSLAGDLSLDDGGLDVAGCDKGRVLVYWDITASGGGASLRVGFSCIQTGELTASRASVCVASRIDSASSRHCLPNDSRVDNLEALRRAV